MSLTLLTCIKKENVDRFAIALAIEIPFPLLQLWHGIVDRKNEEGNTLDYIDLLNGCIPNRWFQVSRATGFRIQGRLRREACSLVNKIKNAPGGRKIKELNCKTFTLSILVNELVNISGVKEIEADLKKSQEEARNVVQEWRQKYINLESEKDSLLEEVNQELRQRNAEIDSLNENVAYYVEKDAEMEQVQVLDNHIKKTVRPLSQIGGRQRLRRLKKIKDKVGVALWFLDSLGLKLSCLKAKESGTGKDISFDYVDNDEAALCDYDKESIEQILFLLDKFCTSDEMYHELAISYDDLPRSYLIKQKRTDLNKLTNVERIPGRYPGAQIPFVETLVKHVSELLQSHPNYGINEPIKVKISCDGAKMSRSTNFVILSFALLQTGICVMSSKGNRTIAIVNGPEKYDTLKFSLQQIISEINNTINDGKINVAGTDRKIEMFLGGDYKFLLMSMGMKGASSDYACLWCKVHKLQRWDTSKDIDFYNSGVMQRTLEDIQICQSKGQFSCCTLPLFNIQLDHIIPDELHLMLRITDRLTENLISEVMDRDGDNNFLKNKNQPQSGYLDALIKLINGLGIPFSMWEKANADGKGSGIYDWTSLVGSDKKKLLKLLPAQLEGNDILFPESKTVVVKLWRDFAALYGLINSSIQETENLFQDVSTKTKEFVELFCSLGSTRFGYTKARVTPYMHALVYHVPIFLRDYNSLKQFTGQGVEKNNDDAKRIFYQKSNKWDAARDVMLHEHRQIALKHCERRKRSYDKQNNDYWGSGIVESRKKRIHSKKGNTSQLQADQLVPEPVTINYDNMTVNQLRDEIKRKRLVVKGLAKMKKVQLIILLKSSCE